MLKLNVVFACAIQFMVLRTGDGYDLIPEYPAKTEYKPGETVTNIRCHGTKTAGEDVIVQFLKVKFCHAETDEDCETFDADPPAGYPKVLVNDATPVDSTEGRYTGTGSTTDTEFDYSYEISNLKPKDYGDFACGVKLGSGGQTEPHGSNFRVKVLGDIKEMAILYKANGQERTTLKNNPERDNPDGKITFETEASGGELACLVQASTSPIIEWDVVLKDGDKTTNVKNKFGTKYPELHTDLDGPFNEVTDDIYYLSSAPSGDRFGYKDSGKILKCSAKAQGYDEQTFESVLDITFPPMETSCQGGEAAVGTTNFKMVCYTRANPAATVTWKANNADLRNGITVAAPVTKGAYTLSVLTIAEVQQSDFTTYTFEATNDHGTVTYPTSGVFELKEGTEVIQVPDVDTWTGYPWNQEEDDDESNTASAVSASGILLVFLALSFFLF